MRQAAAPSGLGLLIRPTRMEASLWRRLRFESEGACRESLFDLYVGLARAIAHRQYRRRPAARIERADYEQFAYEGLLQAIDRYDPVRGVPFNAYAKRRIVGNIADGVARMSEVGAQFSHRRRIEQERLRSLAVAEDGRESPDPLAALSDLAVGLALGIMLEGTALIGTERAPDQAPTAYESLEWRQMQARLSSEIGRLPPKEAVILRQHYENGLSFSRIAELLGLSRGRVSQLHRSALERLRKRMGGLT